MMNTETIIDLIRHGEPEGGQKLRGTLDDPLSELGWEQMRTSVGEHSPWASIVSSPLSRCRYFAGELADKLSLDLDINAEFREIAFGEWEGLTNKQLMEGNKEAFSKYWQDPENNTPPGGEPLSQFVTRVHGAWEDLVEQSKGQHRLLVCHGGVIRAILTHVLGMPTSKLWSFDVPYANVSRIIIYHWSEPKSEGDQEQSAAQLRFHQTRLI
ncbi:MULTISPECIES: histidine phosphatase family protein [unclassified Oleiphilus]|nr:MULTISPECIES: alpha-ribazole phosphatase family protein [unclassified Oleiphilus]MCH2158257.1 alpha-ribazole phosphatase family protein [Oleiphilaceae bacterium]